MKSDLGGDELANNAGDLAQNIRQKASSNCNWLHYAKRVARLNKKESKILDLSKLRSLPRSERSEDVKNGIAKRRARDLADGHTPGSVDWVELDSKHDPNKLFQPSCVLRSKLKQMLISTPARDPARKRIVEKLGDVFAKYYTRYRRQAEARKKSSRGNYVMLESERVSAEVVAVNLILRGITPRELLEHWDKNITNFISDLAIPPLSFLKSPAAVDQVICKQLLPVVKTSTKDKSKSKPEGGNDFSAKNALHVALRSELELAGYETKMLNDRFLLSVQYNAVALAVGDEVFLSDKMRGMVEWLAKNFVRQKGLLE